MITSLEKQTRGSEHRDACGNQSTNVAPVQNSFLSHISALSLFLLGIFLLLTNRWFTEVDDECAIIDRAARPILQTIRLYLSGAGEHEHPPLYDLILHGWLQLTRGEQ